MFAKHYSKQQIEILQFGEEVWEGPFSNWHKTREGLVQVHLGLAAERNSSERGEHTDCFLCHLCVSAGAPRAGLGCLAGICLYQLYSPEQSSQPDSILILPWDHCPPYPPPGSLRMPSALMPLCLGPWISIYLIPGEAWACLTAGLCFCKEKVVLRFHLYHWD